MTQDKVNVTQALEEFEAALNAMPFGSERINAGQQFNAYESAENDEYDEPDYWQYFFCLGPITNHVTIMGLDGEWRAKLVEAAFRVALHSLRHREQAEAESKAREAELVEALKSIAEPINFDTCVGDPWDFYRDLQKIASDALTRTESTAP